MKHAEPPLGRASKAIEDNYDAYPHDEYGYAWDARDLLPLGEVARHDEILAASREQLNAIDEASLSPFQLFALARAYEALGDQDASLQCCARLLDADHRHPALLYPEIALFAARQVIEQPRAALGWLSGDDLADSLEAQILSGCLRHLLGEEHPGLHKLEDSEDVYDVAEEFYRLGEYQEAQKWLTKAREAAERDHNRALFVDIDLLAARLGSAH